MKSFNHIIERESGLQRHLSAGQMAMIAIGGAIGTGLFLGSGFAIGFAGPSVILSYAIGALVALLLMGCLAEMTVAHPTAGSFGAYAEHFVSPLAGFLVRYAYWAAVVLAVGTEVTAVGLYMAYWFPDVPQWWWVLLFSALLIAINATSVKAFGAMEYALSSIKVIAIVAFILVGCWVVFDAQRPEIGLHNYTAHGGFFPKGAWGMWVAVIISIFSYLSIEMIAVAAGEARDPQSAIRTAFRSSVLRLVVFYLLTLALMLAIVPWSSAGTDKSPFVKVMEIIGIPHAAAVLNFVVLVAALSAMNSQLYITTRMMFSLARAGHAPAAMGRLNARGIPLAALAISCMGIAVAMALNLWRPEQAFLLMMAISMFGAMFTWFMVFVTHWFFRRQRQRSQAPALPFQMWGFPWLTLLGAALMLAILLTTLFVPQFRMTLLVGVPFLLALTIAYQAHYRHRAPIAAAPAQE
ncbi:amino acid permease [Vandammella animalimorsus]|uniref:Amino acid permease n=1 Tax=Vandammella animalimorsus TaxID=2029117 RepID=A0A3M6RKL1_9BURK|nr:amino acid permease [Vandammella animalimorsus]RMX14902.1 amino acid permease [Vandammella animalimorsus]